MTVRIRNIGGKRVPFTASENAARDIEESIERAGPTQAEIDAEKEQNAVRLLVADPATRALAEIIIDMWNQMNVVDPSQFPRMTALRFKKMLKGKM